MTLRAKLFLSFLSMAVLVGLTGATGAYFIDQVAKEGKTVGNELAPEGDAAKNIKITAITAHLIFEEIMAGDENENIDNVWQLLDQTLFYADAILVGAEADGVVYMPTTSPEVRKIIEQVKVAVNAFIQSGKARYQQRTASQGVGTGADQAFDQLYADLQNRLSRTISEAASSDHAGATTVVAALGEVKFLIANGHLFLEELLSGDEEETLENVIRDFEAGKTVLASLSNTAHGSQAQELSRIIDQLIAAANTRAATKGSVAMAGSKADQDFDASFEKFIALADQAEKIIRIDMDEGLKSAADSEDNAMTITTMIGLFSVVFAIILATVLGRSVARRVMDLSGSMTALVNGKLDTEIIGISNRDEFGDMARAVEFFKENAIKIREMESNADRILDSISQTTTQIGAAVTQQAASCSEQAAAVTQTSTSLEEIRASADSALDQADSMSNTADQTLAQGRSGQQDMDRVVTAMSDIREKVEAIAHTMVVLSEQTRRVGEITESVSGLAQQSKMLAINASIEAAKAGEAGQGFAVVAEEVASLAEQSEQATSQVRSVLDQIQAASEKAIFATEEGTKQVDAGVTLIQTVGNGMRELLDVIESNAASTRTMVDYIRQQTAGIQQVTGAMGDINQGTNQIAGSTNEINSAMEGLADEVRQLRNSRNDG